MRTYKQAQAWAEYQRAHSTGGWHNQCQRFARSCVDAAAWGKSARIAANAIPVKERHYNFPAPPGALIYYGSSTSGNGHVTFVSSKYGYVYSNDIKRDGRIDLVPWNVFTSAWGMAARFWTTWTPSGRIQTAPLNPPGQNPAPLPPHTVIPTISLARVQKACKVDPGAAQGHKTYPTEVLIVEKALNRAGYLSSKYVDGSFGTKTKEAYSKWQRHLGYTGNDANGVPGIKSLTALGKKYGFRVKA